MRVEALRCHGTRGCTEFTTEYELTSYMWRQCPFPIHPICLGLSGHIEYYLR